MAGFTEENGIDRNPLKLKPMKTIVPFFAALFLLATTSFAQERKTVFEDISLAKSGDGASCMNLAWKKGGENTAYYLVQRSSDGVEFKTVALVFTSEDSSFCDYGYRDKAFASGGGNEVYYRIAIVNEQKELAFLPVKKATTANALASGSSVTRD
jgi:hypothetical protein